MKVGDLLSAGFQSNYRPEITMNHIYFTVLANGAGLAAELSRGAGRSRVYAVELDKTLGPQLTERLGSRDNVDLRFGDAMQLDLREAARSVLGAAARFLAHRAATPHRAAALAP